MTNNDITTAGGKGTRATMSSLEIATLTGKAHKNVLADIRGMLADLGLQPAEFSARYRDRKGEARECFNLPKRESLILVSGYDVKLRAKIVDRWEELESGSALPRGNGPFAQLAREARLWLKAGIQMAKLAGISDGNQQFLSAAKVVKANTGVDLMAQLGITAFIAPQNTALLSPTEVGIRLDGMSARAVNVALVECGYQEMFRDGKGHGYYEPTEKGRAAGATMMDTGKRHSNGTPVRQLKWPSSIVDDLRRDLETVDA